MREVESDARIGIERVLLYAANHADDRDPWFFGIEATRADAFAEGIFVRPVLLGEIFVDDGDFLCVWRVEVVEESALAQRDLHRFEIVAADDAFVGVDEIFAGGGVRPSMVMGPQANISLSGRDVTAPAAETPGMRSRRSLSWREVGGNAVVFDIKDSDGSVTIPFDHPLLGSHRTSFHDLPKFIHFLHSQNMHAIARVAIFRDQRLVETHPELAVKSHKTGQAWRENGKLVWTDPSQPKVQEYDIALAKKAAEAGADEIQFDYVRFPAEGDQKDASFYSRPSILTGIART